MSHCCPLLMRLCLAAGWASCLWLRGAQKLNIPVPGKSLILAADPLFSRLLVPYFQICKLTAMAEEGSGAFIFHAWDRGDRQKFVESDYDEELLFNIPFTGNVKLQGIIVMGEDDDTHPSEMRLFKNIPYMSFADTARETDQMFSLNRNVTGELEYPTKILASQMFIICPSTSPSCAEPMEIFYTGLRGEWTEPHRDEVTICSDEAAANLADHKIDQITPETYFIS